MSLLPILQFSQVTLISMQNFEMMEVFTAHYTILLNILKRELLNSSVIL